MRWREDTPERESAWLAAGRSFIRLSPDGETISLVGPRAEVHFPASLVDEFVKSQGFVIRRTFRTWLSDMVHGRWSA